MKKNILFLMLAFVFFGCPDVSEKPTIPDAELTVEEPVDSVFYFNFSVDPDYIKADDHAYVFLHDSDGELIKYAEVKNGEEYQWEIKSNTPHHLSISNSINIEGIPTLELYPGSEDISLKTIVLNEIETYMSFPVDEPMVLSKKWLSNESNSEQTGEVNVVVNHNEPYLPLYLSDENGGYPYYSLELGKGLSKGKFPTYAGSTEYMLVAIQETGIPKYKMVLDVVSGNNYEFNFNQFSSFDYLIPVKLSQFKYLRASVSSIRISNNKFSQSHYTSIFEPFIEPIPKMVNLGYLKKYPYHLSTVFGESFYGNLGVGYQSILKTQKNIVLPDAQPTQLIDKTIENLEFIKIEGTNFYRSEWYYEGNTMPEDYLVSWTIHSSNIEGIKLKFSSDIKQKIPFLQDLEGFKLNQITQGKLNVDYHAFVKSYLLQNSASLTEFEIYLYLNSYYEINSRNISPSLSNPLSFFEPSEIQ